MSGRMWCAAALAAALVFGPGCRHWCRRPCPPRSVLTPAPSLPGGCPACPPADGVLPPRAQPAPPPPTLPEPPGPSAVPLTPAPSASPFTPSPPVPPGPNVRSQGEDFVWRPSEGPPQARPNFPEGGVLPPERESAKLLPPEPGGSDIPLPARPRQTPEPPLAPGLQPKPADVPTTPPLTIPPMPTPGVKEETTPPATPRPGVREESTPPATLPVDIPQFAQVKKDVASGLKPYPDGLKWLADNGYKAVLHLRASGEEDSGDRKLAEKYGLKYLTLVVSADTLSPEAVQQFNALVADPSNLPLFVYDKDGVVAGGLWYLHFRSVDGLGDEEARTKAGRLGIKPDVNGEHRTMWVAVQKVWAAIKPKE
jgi:protein tyrosine phosphatase (PTP) superfamily phosphohydrolase (DUF442 family)